MVGDSGQEVFVDISIVELQTGDSLLLCTDSLVRHVTDASIVEILRCSDTAADAARGLVDAANAAGGTDNITVIVVRIPPAAGTGERSEFRLAQDLPDAHATSGRGEDIRRRGTVSDRAAGEAARVPGCDR